MYNVHQPFYIAFVPKGFFSVSAFFTYTSMSGYVRVYWLVTRYHALRPLTLNIVLYSTMYFKNKK